MRPPAPANRAEQLRRANDALPAGVKIAYRPKAPLGRVTPYCIAVQGTAVAWCSNLTAAIFVAVRSGGRLALPEPRVAHHG